MYWERVPTLDFNKGDQVSKHSLLPASPPYVPAFSLAVIPPQAMMLPEAVRMVNMLLQRGLTVYCHCTAGINRATLAALGYLTFVQVNQCLYRWSAAVSNMPSSVWILMWIFQGMSLDEGVALVKKSRPVAHPYIECWNQVQAKLLGEL